MALGSYAQEVKNWMGKGKTYEEATKIAQKDMEPSGYENLSGINVPTGFRQSRSAFQDKLTPEQLIAKKQRQLLKAQKNARISALKGAQEQAMTALESERAKVAPEFLKQRGQLSTTAQQAAKGQEQMLAARGLSRGGSAAQGDIARNVALQQGMTDIGEAEAGTFSNIATRETQAKQAFAAGVAQAESEAAAAQAQAEIQALQQAQAAQQAQIAAESQAQFESEKMAQEQANRLQIEQLRIAAQEANAQGDFERARELAKYKNDLEAETIKLRSSTSRSSGGGSSSTVGKLNTTQSNIAKALASRIDSGAESLQAILARTTDPAVKAYLIQIYGQGGAVNNVGALTGFPTSRTISGTNVTVPTWLNTRNLPGLE